MSAVEKFFNFVPSMRWRDSMRILFVSHLVWFSHRHSFRVWKWQIVHLIFFKTYRNGPAECFSGVNVAHMIGKRWIIKWRTSKQNKKSATERWNGYRHTHTHSRHLRNPFKIDKAKAFVCAKCNSITYLIERDRLCVDIPCEVYTSQLQCRTTEYKYYKPFANCALPLSTLSL